VRVYICIVCVPRVWSQLYRAWAGGGRADVSAGQGRGPCTYRSSNEQAGGQMELQHMWRCREHGVVAIVFRGTFMWFS
jgi:hypothetical protein